MNILVIGGTGTVGGQVAKDLVARGQRVRVLTHEAGHAGRVPEGAEAVVGNLANPKSLSPAFEGMEGVFLIVPVSQDETRLGLTAVSAAKSGDIRRMVYSSVLMPPGSEIIPHFRSKIPVEEAVKASGLEYTILRPSNYFQNDLGLREPMLYSNVYPQPIGDLGVNRVDTRDLAEAAVNALLEEGFTGKTFDVGSSGDWTGENVAAVWSKHLGREIRYIGNDLDAWAGQASKMLPDFMVHDFRIMYQYFQEHGFLLPPDAERPLMELLGHEPRSFEAFVREYATAWAQPAGRA